MVASEKREVRSRLALIVQHLLKWQYQPDLRSRSWRATLHVQRRDLLAVLEDSPSLRPFAANVLPASFAHGRHDAEQELDAPSADRLSLDDRPGARPRVLAWRRVMFRTSSGPEAVE